MHAPSDLLTALKSRHRARRRLVKRVNPMQTDEAYARCLALTRAHYENFPVARMVPRRLQPAVAAVYAFARTDDDISGRRL